MEHLRRIALTVYELAPSVYGWRIVESTGDALIYDTELQRGMEHPESYLLTFEAGAAAMHDLIDSQKNHEPRSSDEDEDTDPVEDVAPDVEKYSGG